MIDGEIACVDEDGRSLFNELLFRRGLPIFYAFDILYLNNHDLRQLPLIARKEKLRAVIEKSALPDPVWKIYRRARCGFVQRSSAKKFGKCRRKAQEWNLHDRFRLAESEEPSVHTVGAPVRII